MPKSKKKTRGHVFTIQNYKDSHIVQLEAAAQKAVYLVYGKEVAPETGTPHLQGYVFYKNCRVSSSVCKKLGASWSECARGTPKQNTQYCIKEGNPTSFGVEPNQGERNDLQTFIDEVMDSDQKLDEEVLINDHTTVLARYPRFVDRVQRHYHPPKDLEVIKNFWYYGPAGTGKSYAARKHGSYYVKFPNKWFDGYADEDVVIVDDLQPSHASEMAHFLKMWGDHYPFTAEVKNSSVFIRPKTVIVTANYSIDAMGWDKVTTDAIKRRFTMVLFEDIYEFKPPAGDSPAGAQ